MTLSMQSIPMRQPARSGALLAALCLLLGSAHAARTSPADLSAAQVRYQQERAACTDGSSAQGRSTCLREASAALAAARQGGLSDPGAADLLANQRQRCARLPGPDRKDCIARMQGAGTTSGSVAAGGIYRELVTEVPAPAPPRAATPEPRPMPPAGAQSMPPTSRADQPKS